MHQLTRMSSLTETPPLISSLELNNGMTLGEYIKLQEPHLFPIFTICGRLQSSNGSKSLCSIAWRILLVGDAVLYAIGSLFVLLTEISKGAPYITILLYISFILQGMIVFPLVTTAQRRLMTAVTPSQQASFMTAYEVSFRYFWVSTALSLLYCATLYYTYFQTEEPLFVSITVVLASLCAVGVGWLSMWAVFLLVLDAGALKVDILGLIETTRRGELTLELYEEVLGRKREAEERSLEIVDAVTLVAYISVVSFVASLLLAAGQPHGLNYILGQIALQFREALLILLALPYLAGVNDCNDELSSLLSRDSWHARVPGTSGAGTGGAPIPACSCAQYDMASMEANLRRMVLWSASVDRPLCVYVLGRRVRRREMKAQIGSIVIVGLGSLLTFIITHAN
jgi:hypothetical protein